MSPEVSIGVNDSLVGTSSSPPVSVQTVRRALSLAPRLQSKDLDTSDTEGRDRLAYSRLVGPVGIEPTTERL